LLIFKLLLSQGRGSMPPDGHVVLKNSKEIIRSHQMILGVLKKRSPMEARIVMLNHLDEMYESIKEAKVPIGKFSEKKYCSGRSS
jgi:DNA-binding FadR family transcriptional regulator